MKGIENLVVDHISKLEESGNGDNPEVINEVFLDEQLFTSKPTSHVPWYADFVNYLVSRLLPPDLDAYKQMKFLYDVKFYFWDELYLFK